MTPYFVVRWNVSGGVYVTGLGNRRPYTPHAYEAKRWKTRANAERWLARKDPTWAKNCSIEVHTAEAD